MAKLLVYDLNLQLCDDYQIKKVLSNTIELSSEDEEELIVDDDDEVRLEDYAVCTDYSQDSYDYLRDTSSNETTTAKTSMNLRSRKNIKSLAYLDLRPDTPSDCQSDLEDRSGTENAGNSSNDFCQQSNKSYDYNLKLIKMKKEELHDIDVGNNDLSQHNLPGYIDTQFEENNSFKDFNATSRYGSSDYVTVKSLYKTFKQRKLINDNAEDSDTEPQPGHSFHKEQESLRRRHLKDLVNNLKEIIPSIRSEKICSMKRILAEARDFCIQLRDEEIVCKNLKTKQREINKELRKELRNLICEIVF